MISKYLPGKTNRHIVSVTLMRDEYSGELILETGGDERGKSIIESAFDFLDYPEIIVEDNCYFEYDRETDTFSVSLFFEGLNENCHTLDLENLSKQDIADMIVNVHIVEYRSE